jgi:hypothetical protein
MAASQFNPTAQSRPLSLSRESRRHLIARRSDQYRNLGRISRPPSLRLHEPLLMIEEVRASSLARILTGHHVVRPLSEIKSLIPILRRAATLTTIMRTEAEGKGLNFAGHLILGLNRIEALNPQTLGDNQAQADKQTQMDLRALPMMKS